MKRPTSNLDRYRFSTALLHPRHWPTWVGLLLLFIVTLLPIAVIDALGGVLGRYAARKNRKRFNIANVNLKLCFPGMTEEARERMIVAGFEAQLRSALHYFILWMRPEFIFHRYIRTEGFEQVDAARKRGRQVIVLLSHSVGLDFAVSTLTSRFRTNGPYKPVRNPVIDWFLTYGRMRYGVRHGGHLFTREDGLRPLIRSTRKGELLIYLADEDLGADSSVFAPFYGVPKSTIAVTGRLAMACNAAVLPCISCYDTAKHQYVIHMLPPIEGLTGEDDIADATLVNAAVERTIERCPAQYLWTFRYFQTRPPGEAAVYD